MGSPSPRKKRGTSLSSLAFVAIIIVGIYKIYTYFNFFINEAAVSALWEAKNRTMGLIAQFVSKVAVLIGFTQFAEDEFCRIFNRFVVAVLF